MEQLPEENPLLEPTVKEVNVYEHIKQFLQDQNNNGQTFSEHKAEEIADHIAMFLSNKH